MDLRLPEHRVDDIADELLESANAEYEMIAIRRHELHELLDGDIFYPLEAWPTRMREMFFATPLTDMQTFQLFLFLVGNGCSPPLTCEWILSSQFWSNDPQAFIKRSNQIKFIIRTIDSRMGVWFYYSMHQDRLVYLNGVPK